MHIKPIQTFVVVILFAQFSLNAQSPVLDWAYDISNPNRIDIYNTEVDAQGNVYSIGSFEGSVDFDFGAGTATKAAPSGLKELFLLKTDANGSFQWVKTLPCSGISIGYRLTVDANGAIYLLGTSTADSIDVDPSPSNSYYVANGNFTRGLFIVKLDSQGNFVWGVNHGGDNLTAQDIKTDGNGSLYVLTDFKSGFDANPIKGQSSFIYPAVTGSYDIMLEKLDTVGKLKWQKVIKGAENITSRAFIVSSTHELVLAGTYKGSVDFDPNSGVQIISPIRTKDAGFVLKLDTAGSFVSVQATEGIGEARYTDVVLDANDNIYLGGRYIGQADFQSGLSVVYPSTGSTEGLFLQKLKPTGQTDWVYTYDHGVTRVDDFSFHITLGPNNSVIGAGQYSDRAMKMEPSKANGLILSLPSYTNGFVAKHDSTGKFEWGQEIPSNQVFIKSIMYHPSGGFVLGGFYIGSLQYDPANASSTFTTANNFYPNGFILKYGACVSRVDSSFTIQPCSYYFDKSGFKHLNDTTLLDTIILKNGCDSLVVEKKVELLKVNTDVRVIGPRYAFWNDTVQDRNLFNFSWYDCDSDTLVASNGTVDFQLFTYDGNFALIVTDLTTGCVDTSECVYVNSISIEENPLAQINLYPNPAQSEIHFSGIANNVGLEITVSDIMGRELMLQKGKTSVDVSHLPKGTYLVQVKQGSWTTVKRLVKE